MHVDLNQGRPAGAGMVGVAAFFFALLLTAADAATAQERGNPAGEWRYWGADAWSTRFSPLDQINAANFDSLEVAWIWDATNFGPAVDYVLRSTPIYVDGILYTVAGQRRTVVAIDPSNGEFLWAFREPHTERWERSERFNYGKGVAYGEIDGRGVIYVTTPAFFLHALDAKTGRPIDGFGKPVPVEGFPETGTVDMLADLGHPFDPYGGIPPEIGGITTSSPPIVANGVVIVGNAGSRGRYNTRRENIPGDILGYDARTGEHLWTFHTIPREGEFGVETWEDDSWRFSGNVNAWPPLSADSALGLVYIPTDVATNDYWGGSRPGDNLFANSLVALDIRTGERRWHFQMVHHDVWDWDNPVAPILLDINVDGRRIPAVVQTTKQNFAYTFNRATGEPIWPIIERPVPQGGAPGEKLSPTQPFPTRPAAYNLQGLTENDLIDFTPELRQMALDIVKNYRIGPIFTPGVHSTNPDSLRGGVTCPGNDGGTNTQGGSAVDPEAGILYVESNRACTARFLVPGSDRDVADSPFTFGRTIQDWVTGGAGFAGPEGLPIFKPPYSTITAIDMNTGEHIWQIPNGDTPDRIKNHPRLQGLNLPNTGVSSHATVLATRSLLMYGEGRGGTPRFHAVDKLTGRRLGTVDLPAPTNTAPMTFMHNGVQYVVAAVGGGPNQLPGSLVALRLRRFGAGGGGGGGGGGDN